MTPDDTIAAIRAELLPVLAEYRERAEIDVMTMGGTSLRTARMLSFLNRLDALTQGAQHGTVAIHPDIHLARHSPAGGINLLLHEAAGVG